MFKAQIKNIVIFTALIMLIGREKSNPALNVDRSFDGKYELHPRIHNGLVYLDIKHSNTKIKDTLKTGASDYHYWASGWFNNSNILLLYSSDIGTLAWSYQNNSWVNIDVTEKMKNFSIKMYEYVKHDKPKP